MEILRNGTCQLVQHWPLLYFEILKGAQLIFFFGTEVTPVSNTSHNPNSVASVELYILDVSQTAVFCISELTRQDPDTILSAEYRSYLVLSLGSETQLSICQRS